jgi:hypothetical protein
VAGCVVGSLSGNLVDSISSTFFLTLLPSIFLCKYHVDLFISFIFYFFALLGLELEAYTCEPVQ